MKQVAVLLPLTTLFIGGCEQASESGQDGAQRRSPETREKVGSTMHSRTITVALARPKEEVYAFVTDESKLSRWLTFVTAVKKVDDEWVAETGQGPMVFRFVEKNELGVLDHYGRLPNGSAVLNSMRVIPNGSGSEVIFTLFRRPEMSDEEFAADAATVDTDLRKLKRVLEEYEPGRQRLDYSDGLRQAAKCICSLNGKVVA